MKENSIKTSIDALNRISNFLVSAPANNDESYKQLKMIPDAIHEEARRILDGKDFAPIESELVSIAMMINADTKHEALNAEARKLNEIISEIKKLSGS